MSSMESTLTILLAGIHTYTTYAIKKPYLFPMHLEGAVCQEHIFSCHHNAAA